MTYSPIPDGHIAAIVTSLEMTERPPLRPMPAGELRLERWETPSLEKYRLLYRRVGEPWLWFSRLAMADEGLAAIIHDPDVMIWAVTDRRGIDGKTCMQNGGDGIQLVSGPNETVISGNTIFCNKGNGITIQGKASRGNTLSRNSITGNQGKSISISSNANDDIKPPRLDELTETTLAGVACAGCTVEVYSDMDKQADVYEGMVVAGADGAFAFSKPDGFLYRYVTALATNGKNSSALATAKLIPGTHVARTPTPTATPTEWGATAGPTSATSATPTPRPSGTVPTTAVPTATGALTPPTATMTATGPDPATRTPTLATPGTKKTIHLPWAQKP